MASKFKLTLRRTFIVVRQRWRKLFAPAKRGEPFIVTKIRDGVVTARAMNRTTGKVQKGGEVATFPLQLADYLEVGDITVLEPTSR